MVAGRLASFLDNWNVLTGDTWLLHAIEGYQITVLQLETGSPGCGSGRFSTGLESVERVCQPPMVPGGTGAEQRRI